jgi:hypothetical protein
MDESITPIRIVKSIPRSFAVVVPANHAHDEFDETVIDTKVTDVFGINIPTPLARPKPSGGNRRPARRRPKPFPWEKPIPINTRDIEQELRRYTDTAEPRVARWLYSTWNAQRGDIKFQEIRNAIRDGDIPRKWIEDWKQDYSDYVNDVLVPEWNTGWTSGGKFMAGEMADSLGISWRFPAMTNALRQWVESRGASLAVNLTQSQMLAVRNIVQHYGVRLAVGPRALDKYIRPVIGLTPGEATAVARRRDLLTARGLKPKTIDNAVENYSGFLLRRRGLRIARTETAFAYNYGALDAVREAKSQGLIRAERIEKEYVTAGDERTCPFCSELDEQSVGLEETFPGVTKRLPNVLTPPVHPNCRCVIVYNVVGLDTTPIVMPPVPMPPIRPPVLTPPAPSPKPPAPKPDIPPAIPTAETWTPATTIDEATERIKQHTDDFIFSERVRDRISDEEYLARLNTMDAEFTRCRSFANLEPLGELRVEDLPDAYGTMTQIPINASMELHGGMASQGLDRGEELIAQLRFRPSNEGYSIGAEVTRKLDGTRRGFLPATIRHEFGHDVINSAFFGHVGISDADFVQLQALKKQWFGKVRTWRRRKYFRNNVSEYSQSGPNTEAFPELFVIYTSPKFIPGSIDKAFEPGTEKLIREIINAAIKNKGRT